MQKHSKKKSNKIGFTHVIEYQVQALKFLCLLRVTRSYPFLKRFFLHGLLAEERINKNDLCACNVITCRLRFKRTGNNISGFYFLQ